MDAVSIATTCYFAPCTGSGPWVEADLGNGMFQGANGSNTANLANSTPYVTAMLKNNGGPAQPRWLPADAAGGRHHRCGLFGPEPKSSSGTATGPPPRNPS
ncbi:arabinofuranosidase catalytic domain-containing protein [Streptomyces sp. NBC_01465]|uniref:arabinofuranosidase catalytic domain-containing protein n=1 Tax=Streptomyces sp. NBC_01465 TaxID=2903878 RepID=UPI003FCD4BB8